MLLFVVLSWQIEEKYGMVRVAFIFFWSAIGGGSHALPLSCLCSDTIVSTEQLQLVTWAPALLLPCLPKSYRAKPVTGHEGVQPGYGEDCLFWYLPLLPRACPCLPYSALPCPTLLCPALLCPALPCLLQ